VRQGLAPLLIFCKLMSNHRLLTSDSGLRRGRYGCDPGRPRYCNPFSSPRWHALARRRRRSIGFRCDFLAAEAIDGMLTESARGTWCVNRLTRGTSGQHVGPQRLTRSSAASRRRPRGPLSFDWAGSTTECRHGPGNHAGSLTGTESAHAGLDASPWRIRTAPGEKPG
jgi:hypothetical protein